MVGNLNLAASVTAARGNLASSTEAFTQAQASLSKSAKEFFSLAELIEARYKELQKKEQELEDKENALKLKDEQLSKRTLELEEREKACVAREKRFTQRENEVAEKEGKWAATEQQMALNAAKIPTLVQLDVGGKTFTLPKSDLLAHKGSYFEAMLVTQHSQQLVNGKLFIDRDRDTFKHVFRFLKTGQLKSTLDDHDELMREFEFFKLPLPNMFVSTRRKKAELVSVAQQRIFQTWLPNKKFEIIYKATIGGFAANDFHKNCDNKGPTLTVVRSTTNIFGGYSHAPWDSSGNQRTSHESFIFTLVNPHGIAPTKYSSNQHSYTTYCNAGYGPTFGSGHDLHIASGCNANTSSYFSFPSSFVDTTNYGASTFTGGQNFTVQEIEVYRVSG